MEAEPQQNGDRADHGFDTWTAAGSPVCVAYERGFDEGLAAAVAEIARLRAEIASLRPLLGSSPAPCYR